MCRSDQIESLIYTQCHPECVCYANDGRINQYLIHLDNNVCGLYGAGVKAISPISRHIVCRGLQFAGLHLCNTNIIQFMFPFEMIRFGLTMVVWFPFFFLFVSIGFCSNPGEKWHNEFPFNHGISFNIPTHLTAFLHQLQNSAIFFFQKKEFPFVLSCLQIFH